eukprot:gene8972-18569_t
MEKELVLFYILASITTIAAINSNAKNSATNSTAVIAGKYYPGPEQFFDPIEFSPTDLENLRLSKQEAIEEKIANKIYNYKTETLTRRDIMTSLENKVDIFHSKGRSIYGLVWDQSHDENVPLKEIAAIGEDEIRTIRIEAQNIVTARKAEEERDIWNLWNEDNDHDRPPMTMTTTGEYDPENAMAAGLVPLTPGSQNNWTYEQIKSRYKTDAFLADVLVESAKTSDNEVRMTEETTSHRKMDIPRPRPMMELVYSMTPNITTAEPGTEGYELAAQNKHYSEADKLEMCNTIARLTNKIIHDATNHQGPKERIFDPTFRKGLLCIEEDERLLAMAGEVKKAPEVQKDTDWNVKAVVDEDQL